MMSNSREFNSGNKQIIGGGVAESLSKRGVGDGRELRRRYCTASITMQRQVSLHNDFEQDLFPHS